jgi:hypothetical protein
MMKFPVEQEKRAGVKEKVVPAQVDKGVGEYSPPFT